MEQLMECDMSYVDAFLKRTQTIMMIVVMIQRLHLGLAFNIGSSIADDQSIYQVGANDLFAFFVRDDEDESITELLKLLLINGKEKYQGKK